MSRERSLSEACRKLRERMFPHLRGTQESGSDELRGKNQKGQIRAMMAKDPEGAPRSGERGKNGKKIGGHYS